MAFVKIQKASRGPHVVDEPLVRMGYHRAATGRTIYMSMTRATIKEVGWNIKETDNRDSVTLEIQEGVGEDAGFWLVGQADVGRIIGSEKQRSHTFSLNISLINLKHYVPNEDQVAVHDVEFTIDTKDKTILIQCPDWLRYNPQSYQEPPKLELTPPPKEDKKPSRPTIRVVVDEEREEDEPPLNRRQRRLAASVLTKAMR